jgi:hypothetical protein
MPVVFDQENSFNKTFNRTFAKSNSSKMSAYLIKKGFAKNEKQANIVLLGISAISIIITIVVLNTTVFGGSLFGKKTTSSNIKAVKEYQAQGLKGRALIDKIIETKK